MNTLWRVYLLDQLKIHATVTPFRNQLAQELLNQEADSKEMLSLRGLSCFFYSSSTTLLMSCELLGE